MTSIVTAQGAHGRIAYREVGEGRPVVLLHQTPRSSDEYREVLPLLALAGCRAVAVDTPGFGDSEPVSEPSIERYAAGVALLLDELGVEHAALVGHHTGGVVALELAASRPELVERLVLSSTPLCDAAFRAERAERGPPVDGDDVVASRAPFYPADRPDLLERLRADAAKAGSRAHEGHRAVATYRMEERLPLVRAPVLLIGAPEDPFAYPHLGPLAAALGVARVVELAGGRVPLPDQLPREFAAAILDFLEGP